MLLWNTGIHLPNYIYHIQEYSRSALFWDFAQRTLAVCNRRFGTTHRSHLKGSRSPTTSSRNVVTNYPSTPRIIPEARRSHLHRGGSLKSRGGDSTLKIRRAEHFTQVMGMTNAHKIFVRNTYGKRLSPHEAITLNGCYGMDFEHVNCLRARTVTTQSYAANGHCHFRCREQVSPNYWRPPTRLHSALTHTTTMWLTSPVLTYCSRQCLIAAACAYAEVTTPPSLTAAAMSTGLQIFQKSGRELQILGTRRVTWSKLHTWTSTNIRRHRTRIWTRAT
jgi:hypothetical protein